MQLCKNSKHLIKYESSTAQKQYFFAQLHVSTKLLCKYKIAQCIKTYLCIDNQKYMIVCSNAQKNKCIILGGYFIINNYFVVIFFYF